jgi:hypothetical protein
MSDIDTKTEQLQRDAAGESNELRETGSELETFIHCLRRFVMFVRSNGHHHHTVEFL